MENLKVKKLSKKLERKGGERKDKRKVSSDGMEARIVLLFREL